MKKYIILGAAWFILTGCSLGPVAYQEIQLDAAKIQPVEASETNSVSAEGSIKTIAIQIPRSVRQSIDFVAQAPHASWRLPYKEACEEASIVMATWGQHGESLSPNQMNAEILRLVDWENEHYGYFKDTNADETMRMAREVYGMEMRKITYPTREQLQYELAQGNLLIAHVAGRELRNKYFQQPGPLYHVLVLTGYDQRYFYAHDPGTRRGADYRYTHATIMNALHDFNGGDVYNGEPVVLVVPPPQKVD